MGSKHKHKTFSWTRLASCTSGSQMKIECSEELTRRGRQGRGAPIGHELGPHSDGLEHPRIGGVGLAVIDVVTRRGDVLLLGLLDRVGDLLELLQLGDEGLAQDGGITDGVLAGGQADRAQSLEQLDVAPEGDALERDLAHDLAGSDAHGVVDVEVHGQLECRSLALVKALLHLAVEELSRLGGQVVDQVHDLSGVQLPLGPLAEVDGLLEEFELGGDGVGDGGDGVGHGSSSPCKGSRGLGSGSPQGAGAPREDMRACEWHAYSPLERNISSLHC